MRDGVRFVVIGGGFIGSEIAAALSWSGAAVTMVFPENGIGARLFPTELSEFVNGYYREKGVEVLPGEVVDTIEDGVVRLGSGRTLEADGIIAGLGIEPETELAEAAGLPVDDGIVVDDRGRVGGRDDVFAAGDVARFPAKALGKLIRVEHEDHANSHGRAVGANMAGADSPYDHLPFFYSDLFELGYEAVGEVDSRLDNIASWAEPNRKGVICYVDEGSRPRGFLLWDVWGKVDEARALIEAGEADRRVAAGGVCSVRENRGARSLVVIHMKRSLLALPMLLVFIVPLAAGAVLPTVKTAKNTDLGTVLVSSTGRTLYHFTSDTRTKVKCTTACMALSGRRS